MAQHKGRADDRSPGTSLDHVQSHPHTPQISSDPPKGTGRRSLIRIEPTRAKETLRQPTLDLGEISAELESSLLSSLKAVQTTWRQAASEHRHGDIGREGADRIPTAEPLRAITFCTLEVGTWYTTN